MKKQSKRQVAIITAIAIILSVFSIVTMANATTRDATPNSASAEVYNVSGFNSNYGNAAVYEHNAELSSRQIRPGITLNTTSNGMWTVETDGTRVGDFKYGVLTTNSAGEPRWRVYTAKFTGGGVVNFINLGNFPAQISKFALIADRTTGEVAATSSAPVNSIGHWSTFGVVTRGDFTGPAVHHEGRVAIGGNSTQSGTANINTHNNLTGVTLTADVVVAGNNFTTWQTNHANHKILLSDTQANRNWHDNQNKADYMNRYEFVNGLNSVFSGWFQQIDALNADYASKSSGKIEFVHGKPVLTGTDSVINFFNFTAQTWAQFSEMEANVPVGSRIVINISGLTTVEIPETRMIINGTMVQNDVANLGNKVLYNITGATHVTFNGNIRGSVLAPHADVKSGSHNYGQIIANTVSGGGEFGWERFDYPDPEPEPEPEPEPDPDPEKYFFTKTSIGATGTFVFDYIIRNFDRNEVARGDISLTTEVPGVPVSYDLATLPFFKTNPITSRSNYYITLTERNGGEDGWDYDSNTFEIWVVGGDWDGFYTNASFWSSFANLTEAQRRALKNRDDAPGFENTYTPPEEPPEVPTGYISLNKTVISANGDAVPGETFYFDIVVSDGEETLKTYNNVSVTESQGWSSLPDEFPIGSLYTITEVNIPEYFTPITANPFSGEISQVGENLLSENLVVFENRYTPPPAPEYGNLILTKRVTGEGADPEARFEFLVTIGDVFSETVSGTAGEIWNSADVFPDGILEGTAYSVTELTTNLEYPYENGTAKFVYGGTINGNGTIQPNATINVEVTNDYSFVPPVIPPDIPIFAKVARNVNTNAGISETFNFEFTIRDLWGRTVASGTHSATTDANGEVTVTFNELTNGNPAFNPRATYSVTVSEIAGQDTKWAYDLNTFEIWIVNADVLGFYTNATNRNPNGTIKQPGTATFRNFYDDTEYGGFTLTKEVVAVDENDNVVEDYDVPDAEFTFEVTIGNATQTVTLKAGENESFGPFPAGTTYTIREVGVPEGFSDVTGTINGGIVANTITPYNFVNNYDVPPPPPPPALGFISLEKSVIGDEGAPDELFYFEVIIDGEREIATVRAGAGWASGLYPVGTPFSVREFDVPENFEYKTGNIEAGEIALNENVISFVNEYITPPEDEGRIVLTKTVVTYNSDGEFDDTVNAPDVEFEFIVTIGEDEFEFTLKAGEFWESEYYTVGTAYSVVEVNVPEGFSVSGEVEDGVISVGTNQVDVTNRYDEPPPPPESGKIVVTKTVIGDVDLAPDVEFEFIVTIGEDEFEFTLKAGEFWESEYYIVGTEYSVVEVNVPDRFIVSGEVEDGVISVGTNQVDVTNRYDAPPPDPESGRISLTKTVLGENAPDAEFEFVVTIGEDEIEVTLKVGEVWNSDFYPVGTAYSVIEVNVPSNFTYVTGNVEDGVMLVETNQVNVTNTFSNPPPPPPPPPGPDYGYISLTKSITGAGAPNVDFTFEVTIGGVTTTQTLKAGEFWTSDYYPVGTVYSVTEINVPANFTYVSGNVENGAMLVTTNQVNVVNSYSPPSTPPGPPPPSPPDDPITPYNFDDPTPRAVIEFPEFVPERPLELPDIPTPTGAIEFPSPEVNPATGVTVGGIAGFAAAAAVVLFASLAVKRKKD